MTLSDPEGRIDPITKGASDATITDKSMNKYSRSEDVDFVKDGTALLHC